MRHVHVLLMPAQTGVNTVTTYAHMLYDLDVLDFNNHLSARYGMVLIDVVYCTPSLNNMLTIFSKIIPSYEIISLLINSSFQNFQYLWL
jgi:hypothetical protein